MGIVRSGTRTRPLRNRTWRAVVDVSGLEPGSDNDLDVQEAEANIFANRVPTPDGQPLKLNAPHRHLDLDAVKRDTLDSPGMLGIFSLLPAIGTIGLFGRDAFLKRARGDLWNDIFRVAGIARVYCSASCSEKGGAVP